MYESCLVGKQLQHAKKHNCRNFVQVLIFLDLSFLLVMILATKAEIFMTEAKSKGMFLQKPVKYHRAAIITVALCIYICMYTYRIGIPAHNTGRSPA